jgi:hypothetical protein
VRTSRKFGNALVVIGSMLLTLFITGAWVNVYNINPQGLPDALIILGIPTVGVGAVVAGILLRWP